jgi:hypothetical protein
MQGSLENSGIESGNMVVNLQQFIFAGILFVVFLLFVAVVSVVCRNYKDKIQEKLQGFKTKFVFNGIIRSINLGYLNLTIAATVNI